MNKYVVHFHEMIEYDDLHLYWRKVAYNEVLKRIAELHSQVDLAIVKDEFVPVKPSTPANNAEDSVKLKEGKVEPQQDDATTQIGFSFLPIFPLLCTLSSSPAI